MLIDRCSNLEVLWDCLEMLRPGENKIGLATRVSSVILRGQMVWRMVPLL